MCGLPVPSWELARSHSLSLSSIHKRVHFIFWKRGRIYTRKLRAELCANFDCQLNDVRLLCHSGCFLFQQLPDLEYFQQLRQLILIRWRQPKEEPETRDQPMDWVPLAGNSSN